MSELCGPHQTAHADLSPLCSFLLIGHNHFPRLVINLELRLDPFTDGHFYRDRITVLAGLLAAAMMSAEIRKEAWSYRAFTLEFLSRYLPKVHLWGESAVPYLTVAALALEKRGDPLKAEGLIAQLVATIAEVNGAKAEDCQVPTMKPRRRYELVPG